MRKEVECENNIEEFRRVISRIKMKHLLRFLDEDDTIMEVNTNNELIKIHTPNIKELVLDGNNITAIAPLACSQLPNLQRLIIGDGISTIGSEVCLGCQLDELELPRSLTKIGAKAFCGIRTNFVKYSGTTDDWFEVIRNSGFDLFGKTVILQCSNGDLSFGPLDYDK